METSDQEQKQSMDPVRTTPRKARSLPPTSTVDQAEMGDILKLASDLSGVPGLQTSVTLLTAIIAHVDAVKVYRQQCKDLSNRCVTLLNALQGSFTDMSDSQALTAAYEIEAVISRVHNRMKRWACLNLIKSFVQQSEIREGINSSYRDLETCSQKFQIMVGMDLSRGQMDLVAMQERDQFELREKLGAVLKNQDEMKSILNMKPPVVEGLMQSIEHELHMPNLRSAQEAPLRQGLQELHRKWLPPMIDLTGQVTKTSDVPVAYGAFNDIYTGMWMDEETVALRLPRALVNSPVARRRFLKEVELWRHLQHPNITRLYGIVYFGDHVYSVSKWMEKGNAIVYVQNNPGADRLKIFAEVASGMECLHSHKIVHGDLRGANVLIGEYGQACLSDFGLSKFLEQPESGTQTSTVGANPYRWQAPELIEPELVGQKTVSVSTFTDVWSFGMLCLELMTGQPPFAHIRQDIGVAFDLTKGRLPQRPSRGLSDELWALMLRCWEKNPESRPPITEVRLAMRQLRGHSSPAHEPISLTSFPSPADSDSNHIASVVPGFSKGSGRLSTGSTHEPHIVMDASQSVARPSDHSLPPIIVTGSLADLFSAERIPDDQIIQSGDTEGKGFDYNRRNTTVAGLVDIPRNEAELFHLEPFTDPSSPPTWPPSSPDASHLSLRSTLSSGQSISSNPLDLAINDPTHRLQCARNGTVEAGTLEGLIDRLLKDSEDLVKDRDYQKVFLATYWAFTSAERVYDTLVRRFDSAALNPSKDGEDHATVLRYNVILVMRQWLMSPTQVNVNVLSQMKNFCLTVKGPAAIALARDVTIKIDEQIRTLQATNLLSPVVSSPRPTAIPKTADITPRDIAIALTIMEGDRYSHILPADYIYYFQRLPYQNNIAAARSTNSTIINWVKKSILRPDSVEDRGEVLKFFVNAAEECRRLGNFGSMSAIVSALTSDTLSRLHLTCSRLKETRAIHHLWTKLRGILQPRDNHKSYRAALANPKSCVPWLDVHLQDIDSIFRTPPVVEIESRPLIDFRRCAKLHSRITEMYEYQPPALAQHREAGALAYLERQLRSVPVHSQAVDFLDALAVKLEAEENRMRDLRLPELKSVGLA